MTAPLASRLLSGALAGLTATTAMTAAMRRLHAALSPEERYPLPPREITERLVPDDLSETAVRDSALAAHFAYGAVVGALLAAGAPRQGAKAGAVAGAAVWAASYFGWIPAFGVLRPASTHPLRRDALMISAHLVWGAVNALAARELAAARETILADGPKRDAPTGARTKKGAEE
jgi:hypothetical protein